MTTITVTFDPPLPSDSPATFNSKAFDTLGDLNTWSGQANTVAGEVNTNAANAATSAGTASTHATTATTQAGIATTQAGIATTQAGLATTNGAAQVALAAAQVSLATTQANTATTQAGTATTQAGIATTKASEADASAIAAAASAASIAPGSLLTAANPSYTGTLTGGTGVVNLGSGQVYKAADGKVGIGTASPTQLLDVAGCVNFQGSSTFPTTGMFLRSGDNQLKIIAGSAGIAFSSQSGASTLATLDVSGNLAISGKLQTGATAPATFDMALLSGTNATANDLTLFGPSTSQVRLQFSRSGASGRGEVGYDMAADVMRLVTSGAGRVLVDASGNTTPGANGTQAFGSTSLRWSQVWCTAGAFNTSDARLKTVPVSFTAKEVAAAKALSKEIALYQWLESVEAKGADKARQHVGLTVQRAEQVLKEHGLDPWRYGFMSYDKWDDVLVDHPAIEAIEAVDAVLDDEGNVVTPAVEAVPAKEAWIEVTLKAGEAYAFRYDQLNLFISRGLNAEIEAMQAQIDAQNSAMQLLASRLAALEAT